ncbi:MAG: tetratricopeptide repeat protein, partial [Pseudomonadota bacterium]
MKDSRNNNNLHGADRKKRLTKVLPGGGELKLVRTPDAEDHFLRAMDLRRGSETEKMDEDAAVELLMQGARNGHRPSCAALALLCEGKVAEEDRQEYFDRAKGWIIQNAAAKDQWAALFQGVMYFDGMFADQHYEKAAQFFQISADQGNSCAQGFLGYMYTTGQGVLKNRHTAVNYYRAASEKGHVVAQFDLGVCYSQGRGVPKDKKEALKWFRMSADRGDVHAQAMLAKLYLTGNMVEIDEKKAVHWF